MRSPDPPSVHPEPAAKVAAGVALALLFAVHVLFGQGMRRPIMFSDEIAYLSHARFFAGDLPFDLKNASAYFHFGYSLFLTPLVIFIRDPQRMYQAAVFLNGVFASLAFLPMRKLALRFGCAPSVAWRIAFVAALYPAFLVQGDLMWTESLLVLLFAMLLILVGRCEQRRDLGSMLWVVSCAALIYVVHPRGLPILAILALAGMWAGWKRALSRVHVAIAMGVGLALVLGDEWANRYLMQALWGGSGAKPLGELFQAFTSVHGIRGVLAGASGEGWYLLVATLGLIVAGATWMFGQARRPGSTATLCRITLGCSLGVFVAAVTNMEYAIRVEGFHNLDYLVCGRQNEMFLPPFLIAGFVALSRWSRARRAWTFGATVLCVALAGGWVTLERGRELVETHLVGPGILGILPWVQRLHGVEVVPISLGALAACAVIYASAGRSVALVIAAGWFVVTGVLDRRFVADQEEYLEGSTTLAAFIAERASHGEVAYDSAHAQFGIYWSYQFLLPEVRFRRFDSRRERPPAPLVVSSHDLSRPGARLLGAERHVDQALFLVQDASIWLPGLDGPAFGGRAIAAVPESGFGDDEVQDGVPVRWTEGDARLVLPIGPDQHTILIDLAATGRATYLDVRDGDHLLTRQPLRPGEMTFRVRIPALHKPTLDLRLQSETFVPAEVESGSTDHRHLGVQVREIRLVP